MTLVQSDLNVDLSVGSWNCPNHDPNAFKQLIGRFDNADVARVTINFDMTKNHISKLVGLSATMKRDGGGVQRPRYCKACFRIDYLNSIFHRF